MKDERIKIIITEDGLYSKWVGAELVSAIDSRNPNAIAYVLRNRITLTDMIMLGKPETKVVEIYVEALNEECRTPVAIFRMSKEKYESYKPEIEQNTLKKLADAIQYEDYFDIGLEYDEDEQKEAMEEVVADKSAN